MKLSILLPCYNVEQYINRAVTSIINQHLNFDYEIIAVDDCSTDATYERLVELKNKYPQLIVIKHEENQKLTGARTTGIKASSGEYIMLMDPDDYLLPNKLYDALNTSGWKWDILFCNVIEQTLDAEKISYKKLNDQYSFNINNDRKNIFQMAIAGFAIAKIFKRDLFKNLLYFSYHYNVGEDRALNYEVFNRAKIIKTYTPPIYYYAYNQNSLVKKGFNITLLNWQQSWVKNIMDVSDNCDICKESLYYAKKYTERYTISMLLSVCRDNNSEKLIPLWKSYFYNQSYFYGIKGNIYRMILKIDSIKLSKPLFLIMLCQWNPYKERLERIINKIRKKFVILNSFHK